MIYTVQLKGISIGSAQLEHLDPTKEVARGSFHPASGYQLVQDVFRLYAEAVPETPGSVSDAEKLRRYYKSRDALGLELLAADGRTVVDATVHLFERATVDNKTTMEIEVHISDRSFWRQERKGSEVGGRL